MQIQVFNNTQYQILHNKLPGSTVFIQILNSCTAVDARICSKVMESMWHCFLSLPFSYELHSISPVYRNICEVDA
jgi:hypothetical protein